MSNITRKFRGIWIEASIWEAKDLTLLEKVLIAEIDSLQGQDGCFASNQYFADFFGVAKGTIANNLSTLTKKGWILVKHDNGLNRRIFLTSPLHGKMNPPSRKNEPPLHGKMNPPSRKNEPYNIEDNKGYNIEDKYMSGKPDERPSSSLFDLEAETQKEKSCAKKEKDVTTVIEYLNTAAERKFASEGKGSAANRDLVFAVLSLKKEKVEVQDCFDVVDMLCLKWKGDLKMKPYLQPSTIFAKANFLKYLSQVQEMKQNQNSARDVVNGMDRKNMTQEGKVMVDRMKQQQDFEQTMILARELAESGY